MDAEHDRLFNVHWWATALIQRRQLDVLAHAEGRAHQSADPHAVYESPASDAPPGTERLLRPQHGSPDYTLTAWERAWIVARINDTLVDRIRARQESEPVLAEPVEAHEARELHERAIAYFDAPHDVTRARFHVLRHEHEEHREATLARHKALDAKAQPAEHERLTKLLADHKALLDQVDSYVAPMTGLIDRHIVTVKTNVAEKRRIAQQHVIDCAKVLEVKYEVIVAEYTARVEAEVRQ